jgi:hypothetical protein
MKVGDSGYLLNNGTLVLVTVIGVGKPRDKTTHPRVSVTWILNNGELRGRLCSVWRGTAAEWLAAGARRNRWVLPGVFLTLEQRKHFSLCCGRRGVLPITSNEVMVYEATGAKAEGRS